MFNIYHILVRVWIRALSILIQNVRFEFSARKSRDVRIHRRRRRSPCGKKRSYSKLLWYLRFVDTWYPFTVPRPLGVSCAFYDVPVHWLLKKTKDTLRCERDVKFSGITWRNCVGTYHNDTTYSLPILLKKIAFFLERSTIDTTSITLLLIYLTFFN